MKTKLCILFICFVYSCGIKQPRLKKAHVPKISQEVDILIEKLKIADLKSISVDRNIRGMLDYSRKEAETIIRLSLQSDTTAQLPKRILDENKILTEPERQKLIEEIRLFKKSRIRVLNYYDYETKYCNDNMTLQKWTLKEKYNEKLLEYKEYFWNKYDRKRKIQYSQFCKVIRRVGSPEKLEISSLNYDEDLSIKIDGKPIKIISNRIYLPTPIGDEIRDSFAATRMNCD